MSKCLVRGSINIDEFFHVAVIVSPGQTISSTGFERRAGGKGANQAVAIAKAGGHVDLVGAVGEDGLWITDYLRATGVGVQSIAASKGPTGRAVIQLTPAGENSIILHKGANYETLPAPTPATFLGLTHLLIQNEVPFQDTLAYLSLAYAAGVVTIYNPSPMPSVLQLGIFPWNQLSWLVVNEGEAAHLLASIGADNGSASVPASPADWPALTSLHHAHALLAKLHLHSAFASNLNLVCTLGAGGVLACIPALPAPIYLPAADLRGQEVKDTTGAGDCFTGYFVAGLMESRHAPITTQEAVKILGRAVEAAGICVLRRGAMESIPTRDEVGA